MRIKKLISFSMIFIFSILLRGCFNYNDINKVSFATSTIFDEDDSGNIVLYVDCVKPYRSANESSDKGRRIIYRGIGKTVSEALKDVNLASSYEINYSQNRAYIFTEKTSKKGIGKYLNLINNNQEFQIKPDMFVYFGNVDELLEVTSSDEEHLGLYLEELVHRNKRNPKAVRANISDYFNNTMNEEDIYIVGNLKIREDALDEKIEIGGGSIMQNNTLVEKMSGEESAIYNLLMKEITSGTLEFENPQGEEGYVVLQIIGSSVKTNLRKEEGRNVLTKDIAIKASIAETQGKLLISKELVKEIKELNEEKTEEKILDLFKNYKSKGLDIFGGRRMLEIKYEKDIKDNYFEDLDLEVNVDLIIEGTSLIKDTL
ncbi:Ger(x)C family spore germination protein [Clostridium sp.]|uniref:Ger(x)C family spore germination protein n=1 Tax=Clostridium sp. TaxID=1506 RepID=UPI0026326006|nr:Ger(x)C family spore germination protein [Clostridium sp.]